MTQIQIQVNACQLREEIEKKTITMRTGVDISQKATKIELFVKSLWIGETFNELLFLLKRKPLDVEFIVFHIILRLQNIICYIGYYNQYVWWSLTFSSIHNGFLFKDS